MRLIRAGRRVVVVCVGAVSIGAGLALAWALRHTEPEAMLLVIPALLVLPGLAVGAVAAHSGALQRAGER